MRGWTRLDSFNACIILDDSSFVTTHVVPVLTPCVTVVARQGRGWEVAWEEPYKDEIRIVKAHSSMKGTTARPQRMHRHSLLLLLGSNGWHNYVMGGE
ncbi:hypothetical protein HaLaN_01794 [Haematococcus lacustris]|uniref:Uncharacterized protein n=1 Tax=Haematococcus lacustris TaxID=44745 RepID=A0A699YA73_HAELA|nr:hypothetical protein HaLaN_01794 [Haematococcus lacustris]